MTLPPNDRMHREKLITEHNAILANNYSIRVNARWGDFTEYSVRIKGKWAAKILDCEEDNLPQNTTFRLCFGVERASDTLLDEIVDVHWHDPESGMWESLVYDPDSDELSVDAVHLLREAGEYLRRKHPDAKRLLEIDRELMTVLN